MQVAIAAAEFGLNEKQAEFARALSDGLGVVTAAKRSGYSELAGYRLTAHPAIAAAVEAELRRKFMSEGAPLAYRTAVDMLKDKTVGGPTRAMLVKTVLGVAGFVQPTSAADPASGRPLNELTAGELLGFIGQRQAEIAKLGEALEARANAARLVNDAPTPDVVQDKAPDLLD